MRQNNLRFLCKKGDVEYFSDDKFIYAKRNGEEFRLALFKDGNYYKLRLFNGIPILEIDGIRMQLVRNFRTPLEYSKEVVRKLGIKRHDIVLDSCMGLGYTAIEASKKASRVLTFEISDAVYTLATWNPWSEELFSEKIEIRLGEVSSEIKTLESNFFSAIIHDPPRISKAPQLYSLEFYHELYRIAKPGARIFHYVGHPGRSRGRKIENSVTKRLRTVGFTDIRYDAKLQGIFFRKHLVPFQ